MKKIVVVFFVVLMSCKTNGDKNTASPEITLNTPKNVIHKEGVDLEIYDYEGFETFLRNRDGKTYVVNFWATWCKPCVEELPYFEQLNTTYKDKGVAVILVSLDMPGMIEKQLIPFIKDRNLQSEVIVLDDPKQNAWIPKVDKDWSGAIPATLIYKNDEKAFFEQSFTYETLEEQLLKFLN